MSVATKKGVDLWKLQGVQKKVPSRNQDDLLGPLSSNFKSERVVVEAANSRLARIFAPRFPTSSDFKFFEWGSHRSS